LSCYRAKADHNWFSAGVACADREYGLPAPHIVTQDFGRIVFFQKSNIRRLIEAIPENPGIDAPPAFQVIRNIDKQNESKATNKLHPSPNKLTERILIVDDK
jgi:hypothetical protein